MNVLQLAAGMPRCVPFGAEGQHEGGERLRLPLGSIPADVLDLDLSRSPSMDPFAGMRVFL